MYHHRESGCSALRAHRQCNLCDDENAVENADEIIADTRFAVESKHAAANIGTDAPADGGPGTGGRGPDTRPS